MRVTHTEDTMNTAYTLADHRCKYPANILTLISHAYPTPEVALLAHYPDLPRILRVEADKPWRVDRLTLRTDDPVRVLGEVAPPELSDLERVAWVVVLTAHTATRDWSVNWLSGENRSYQSAMAAAQWHEHMTDSERAARVAAMSAAMLAEGNPPSPRLGPQERAYVARTGEPGYHAAHAAEMYPHPERLMPALMHARSILAGDVPAELSDALPPLTS